MKNNKKVNESSLVLNDLTESLKRHNQEIATSKVMKYIGEKILPMYANYPYIRHGLVHQSRKLLTVETIFTHCKDIYQDFDESTVLLATVLNDIGYVADEFNYQYYMPNPGLPRRKFIDEHQKEIEDIIPIKLDMFGYNPLIDSLIACGDNISGKSGYRINPYSILLHDIDLLTLAITYGQDPSELALLIKFDKLKVTPMMNELAAYEEAVHSLQTRYGVNGTCRLANMKVKSCQYLYEKYNVFATKVSELSPVKIF